MRTSQLLVRCSRLVMTGILVTSCAGCLAVPIHHAKHIRSLSAESPPQQLDLTFVKVGTTTRNEVVERLSWIDTGITNNKFFLGRYAENSWGVAWGAAAYYTAAVGYNEIWKAHNVIIDFDDHFVVSEVKNFANKDIIAILYPRLNQVEQQALDLTSPVKVPVQYFRDGKTYSGNLILSHDEMEFVELPDADKKGKYSFKMPPANVSGITMCFSDPAHPEQACEVLHFVEKTRIGKKMAVHVNLVGTAQLVEYLALYGSIEKPTAISPNSPDSIRRPSTW